MILSFLSAGLGIYSIWQTYESGKQANEILKSVQAIEREQHLSQDLMRVITYVAGNGTTIKMSSANKNDLWEMDNDIT